MIKKLCVFCGSRSGRGEKYLTLAKEFAEFMSEQKIDLVYGAGAKGVMGMLADSVLERGGEVTGVYPRGLFHDEHEHKNLSRFIEVSNMHERKKRMYELSDAFVALPGGFGTLEEFFEILTWRQLKIHPKPVFLFNFENFYGHLIEHFFMSEREEFLYAPDMGHYVVVNSFDDLKNHL